MVYNVVDITPNSTNMQQQKGSNPAWEKNSKLSSVYTSHEVKSTFKLMYKLFTSQTNFQQQCSGVGSGGREIRETKRTSDSQVPQGSGLLSKLYKRV